TLKIIFFQAEDGIRDFHVTGFRRVLFRSSYKATCPETSRSLYELCLFCPRTWLTSYRSFTTTLGLAMRPTSNFDHEPGKSRISRSEERRVGKVCINWDYRK